MVRRVFRISILVVVLWAVALVAWAQQPASPRAENPFQQFLLDIRADQETLADRVYGGGSRPDAWTGNTDLLSQSFIADLWFDNEQIADAVFGTGGRPGGWIGATTPNAQIVARNVRHDLELSADAFIGARLRPEGWVGAPLVNTCDRTILNIVYLLETRFSIRPATGESVLDYCRTVEVELEDRLINVALADEQVAQVPGLILAVRGDLERVADERLGVNVRPEGWIGNKDINSQSLALDILSDLERLADEVLGNDQRPNGWLASVSSSLLVTYRNLRADVELLADVSLGQDVRPRGWQGDSRLVRCDGPTQNLVLLVESLYLEFDGETASASTSLAQYCQQVALAANNLAENPPALVVDEEDEVDDGGGRFVAESDAAFTYLDPAARQYMGIMPRGVQFRAWYRNFGESTMMFVSGVDFALFIDRRWTTLPQNLFERLPTLDGVRPLTFCDARWCNGPGPTPTPTGSGPIFDIIVGVTPPATLPADQVGPGGDRQLVSWNHIRVIYVFNRPDIERYQVSLEICTTTAQVACEPVISVFNNNTGVAIPVVSQVNGLNVYELPYGYTSNLVIDGPTLRSSDVWVNDPSIGQ